MIVSLARDTLINDLSILNEDRGSRRDRTLGGPEPRKTGDV